MKERLKLRIGRKAVSPVLATLLMIAVAVSMSVILFMWSQGFLATTSEAASSQQQAQNVAAQSSITIESVQFTNNVAGTGSKGESIIVRNVGTAKITVDGLYINNASKTLHFDDDGSADEFNTSDAAWSAYDKDHNYQSSNEVPPQGYALINVKHSWTAGTTYIIKVTTSVGTFAETVVTAPA